MSTKTQRIRIGRCKSEQMFPRIMHMIEQHLATVKRSAHSGEGADQKKSLSEDYWIHIASRVISKGSDSQSAS